jgi:branched-chain amino acid aminotransferase
LVNIPYKWDNHHLIRDTHLLLERNHLRNAYIRPLVFCKPNMKLDQPTEVSIMISAWEWGAYLGESLLKVGISTYERPNPQSIEVEAKITGHYVTSILASADAKSRGYDEALLLDQSGNIAQSPGANFFMERNGKLYTPPIGNIFPGITRSTVIELCHYLGIEIVERHLTVNDLKHATGAFFCGTATEIIGIRSIDRIEFTDWEDSVGATIQRAYKNLVLEKENFEVII